MRYSHSAAAIVCGIFTAVLIGTAAGSACAGNVKVSGERRVWRTVTLTVDGPDASEDGEPNPFRDYRLGVTFEHESGAQLRAPGYFAADGNAAETGAAKGDRWRVHFVPDRPGQWRYTVAFRKGEDVAIADDPESGAAVGPDGATGRFTIKPAGGPADDPLNRGVLEYVGERYLKWSGSGDYFLKGGADSPENFLAYAGFDGTYRIGKLKKRKGENFADHLHRYEPHVKDWKPGDPTWKDGRGKGIVGALNYLASEGMNSVYMLTMNVGGDGKDVWPWISHERRFRFDCSKLAQWDIVFDHMDRLGLQLHLITQETENDQLLDGGALGPQRKLYYRELIARFAHHRALVWNLGEENTNTDEQRKAFAAYIRRLDPYGHPIVVHTYPGKYDQVYEPLLGCEHFEGPSIQLGDMSGGHELTKRWVQRSAESGRPWFVCLDEPGNAGAGVKPDKDDPHHNAARRQLWGNLLAGGAGVEWYFGYKFAHNDLNCEDWRSRDILWDQTRHALRFFHDRLPFTRMRTADDLASGGAYCFADPGEVYAVYRWHDDATKLKLKDGTYRVRWFNPRDGGGLHKGSVESVQGGGRKSIGHPPGDRDKDWVALVRRGGK